MPFVFGSLAILLLAACGASSVAGSGRCDGGDCASVASGVGEPCSDDGACTGGAVCADTGVRCVRAPCPAWGCFVPCRDDADCGAGLCEPAPRSTLDGARVRVCAP
jgi:hypothetical protein